MNPELTLTAEPINTSPRRIVSYFEHEFGENTATNAQRDIKELVDAQFSTVVLCVTETDMQSRQRQAYLKDLVTGMKEQGLDVWADPWGVGSVHGGEAVSHFKLAGEKSCMCNPRLDGLVRGWIDTVSELDIRTIFWDEPEMKCQDHLGTEGDYIARYTAHAEEYFMKNAVCLPANERHKGQLQTIASLSSVHEIATDPYYPNAFTKIPEERRLDYVAEWAAYTKETAEMYDKPYHVWVQLFDIPEGKEYMVEEHIAICQQAMADVALWGFKGCISVPGFIKPTQAHPLEVWERSKRQLTLAA